MPLNLPQVPFKLTAQDVGMPDIMAALTAGQQYGQSQQMFPQKLQEAQLLNAIKQVQAKYAEPMAAEDLIKAQQFNKMYIPDIQSQIGLRGATGRHLGAETDKIRYLLSHPGFMGGDETKSIEALRQMGLLDKNYQQVGSTPQQAQPSSQMGGFTPIPGNAQAEQIAQANEIAQTAERQRQSMNVPQSQVSADQGFNVNNLVQALINKPMTDLQYKQTLTKVMQQNLAGKPYLSMPAVEKEYAISQARAFGYTGEQASRLFMQGHDLASMAQAKGYDGSNPSSWPIARGAPTTAIQTRIQRANSTLAALNSIESDITAAYAKYAPRFRNVSPGLIKDMISGENPDAQADALAAYALYPEISALRINAMGGNVGEGAIQHMADAAFARLNTLGISPNSLVYQKIQKKVSQLINKMNRAENAAVFNQTSQSYEADDRNNQDEFSGLSNEQLKQAIAGGGL